MVAPYNPPISGQDFIFYAPLFDMAAAGSFKASPTIATGDFKFSADDGGLTNLATLPTVSPAGSIWVKFTLSSSEFVGGNIKVQGIDQTTPKEWSDFAINIVTTT